MGKIYTGIERLNPSISNGLTNDQVNLRIGQGLLNIDTSIKPRSIKDIIKDNVFTLFNLINLILAIALIYTGSYKNLMFIGVVICNLAIGIIQEIRTKTAIDKLRLITSKSVTVIRGGKEIKIKPEDVVLDDIIKYSAGNQVIADGTVMDGICEANESLLTGESDLIYKQKGDTLLSGSFVASGGCYAKAEKIGKDNYSSTILSNLKHTKKIDSEIKKILKNIKKYISKSIVKIGVL